jgi:hypothetical protein
MWAKDDGTLEGNDKMFTFLGMPTKEREGASAGGKVCSYKGPTLSSSTATIPLVSRNGNVYEYLHA